MVIKNDNKNIFLLCKSVRKIIRHKKYKNYKKHKYIYALNFYSYNYFLLLINGNKNIKTLRRQKKDIKKIKNRKKKTKKRQKNILFEFI
jgi:hypothetical protein